MSTYNGAPFLDAQLASLAAQEGVECDLFVRDDGSTDNTLAVLAGHAGRWPRLAAPLTGPNLGPAMSFLALLRSVPGDFDYYAFCDQDDVWLPHKLARAAEHLGALPKATPALYCSQVTCADQDLTPLGEPFNDGDGRFEHLLFQNIAYGITVVMNRRARATITAHTPAAGVIMHDWWCALVVSAFGTIIYDAKSSALYRQHGRNVIGAQAKPLADFMRSLRILWRNPRQFWPIHAQSAEFLRLYEGVLAPKQQQLVEKLVASKSSVGARISYALSGRMVRSRPFGTLSARALILAGLY